MLKAVLRYDFIKKAPVFLLMLCVMLGAKIFAAGGFDTEAVQIENELICGAAGLSPAEAEEYVNQATEEMLTEIMTRYSGIVREEKAQKLTEVSSVAEGKITLCLTQAYDNIDCANGSETRLTLPTDYYTANIGEYKNLSYPDAVGGRAWNNFFTLRGLDFVMYFAFICVAVVFVRPYEERICDADRLTKYGVKYHRTRFIFFLLLIISVCVLNFAADVIMSNVLGSAADIFTASIRGLEQFCDSFSGMTIFRYLVFSLIIQLCGTVCVYCCFFLLARGIKDLYRFTVISVTAMLFLNIIHVTLPVLSCYIPLGAADMVSAVSDAATIFGVNSGVVVLAENVAAAVAVSTVTWGKWVRR